MKIDLKPCPFCGAPAHKWSWNGGTRIDCSAWESSDKRTHYVGIGAKTEEEAIEAWNRRAKLTKYSVGCGFFGIYAGVLKSNGEEWKEKTDVTIDAMGAVAQHLIDHGTEFSFEYKGKKMKLKVEEEA